MKTSFPVFPLGVREPLLKIPSNSHDLLENISQIATFTITQTGERIGKASLLCNTKERSVRIMEASRLID